ncbi:MAG: hypothetical protein ACLQJF_06560 [Candidatus Sulfotelmatobacter sp.]|jgi:hypothetical protein
MSDEMNQGHSGHETEFEREDLGTRSVFAFMIGLAIVGVIIYFIIVGMYTFLDKYERSQMATASPLAPSKGATSRVVTQADMDKAFKDNGAPMLETDERGQFRDFLVNQENQLNSYGWIDKDAGVAHIPIERAMELTVGRIPVRPQPPDAQAYITYRAPVPYVGPQAAKVEQPRVKPR